MMHWATALILVSGLVSANNLDHAKQKGLVQFFNFDDVCPPDEAKKEVCLYKENGKSPLPFCSPLDLLEWTNHFCFENIYFVAVPNKRI